MRKCESGGKKLCDGVGLEEGEKKMSSSVSFESFSRQHHLALAPRATTSDPLFYLI